MGNNCGVSAAPRAPTTAPRVLCLASPDTTRTVISVAQRCGLSVVAVETLVEAHSALQQGEWCGVVCALGTQQSNIIFDQGGDRSSLIERAKGFAPPLPVVIYSYTACDRPKIKQVCLDANADTVLCSADDLEEFIRTWGADMHATAMDIDSLGRSSSISSDTNEWPHYTSSERYQLISRLVMRAAELHTELGDAGLVRNTQSMARRLVRELDRLPRPLTLPGSRKVRFVHISDTHHHHTRMHIPGGDVLLHTGDIVGNYGKQDLLQHFRDFIEWVKVVSQSFRMVVFIAGNHDTILDGECYDTTQALDMVRELPSNAVYLNNTGVEFHGLSIWGSSAMVSRMESMNKRFYSDAFERTDAVRTNIWQTIPDNLSVLMTHSPPQDILTYSNGCQILRDRLQSMRQRRAAPKFHVFGHDHDSLGVVAEGDTICINSAQELLLRQDPNGGGAAWVFDIPL